MFRILLTFIPFFTSCGSDLDFLTERKTCSKDYRIFIEASSSLNNQNLRILAAEFNAEIGFPVLKLTEDVSQANSILTVQSGLFQTQGKIGLGQWVRSASKAELPPRKSVSYSMNIWLDEDFLNYYSDLNNAEDRLMLKTLFNHEIGHGLTLGHSEDYSHIMYPTIGGKKDFEAFYQDAFRAFQHSDCN